MNHTPRKERAQRATTDTQHQQAVDEDASLSNTKNPVSLTNEKDDSTPAGSALQQKSMEGTE